MNNLLIPPSPNWYEPNILSCAPDNTIIYGSRSDLVIIRPKKLSEPADITVLSHAHNDRITCVGVSPAWDETKLAFALSEDKVVKLWDTKKNSVVTSHRGHTSRNEKVVGASFAGNSRIISVAENGYTIIWPFGSSGQLIALKDFFGMKVHITCISCCIHKPWLAAYGSKGGLIFVADIRKTGKVLYKLRGHEKSILSLVWCPVVDNVLPQRKPGIKIERSTQQQTKDNVEAEETGNSPGSDIKIDTEKTVESYNKDVSTDNQNREDIEKTADTETQKRENLLDNSEHESTLNEVENAEEDAAPEKDDDIKYDPSRSAKKGNLWVNLKHADDDEIPENFAEHSNSVPQKLFEDDFLSACKALKTIIAEQSVPMEDEEDLLENPDRDLLKSEKERKKVVESNKDEANEDKNSVQLASEDEVCLESVTDILQDIVDNAVESTEEKEVCLLASSDKGGRSICVWRALSDGRLQTELSLPNKSTHRNKRYGDKAWIVLCWNTPTTLLCSSHLGELLEFDLNKAYGKRPDLKPKLVHNDHQTGLFSIATKPWSKNDNWREETVGTIWTVGQDRYILNTSLGIEREVLISYPTLGGTVLCFSASPLDPHRIGIGIGDGTARVWDLSKPQNQYVTMTNLWQKMQSKILSLAWHPKQEVVLAYSTFEGRVGLVDTSNTSKSPTLMCQYFKNGVYKIEYGPMNKDPENIGLFALSEGILVCYNTKTPLEDPKIIPTQETEYLTQFSWKKDNSALATGFKSGSLAIYSADFELIKNVYVQQKAVQCISWHPESSEEKAEETPHAGWMAVATNDTTIVIYDYYLLNNDASGDQPDFVVATLNKHLGSVKALDWSQFNYDLLVSAGEDGLAIVWNVNDQTALSSFTGHNGESICAIIWSPLDADYVISGGKDTTIRIWKYTDHPFVENLATIAKTSQKKRSSPKTDKDETTSVKSDDSSPQPATAKQKKINRDLLLPTVSKLNDHSTTTLLQDCERLFNEVETCIESALDNEKCIATDATAVFKTKEQLIKLLDGQSESHNKRGLQQCASHISLWQGNIADTIRNAIKTETVTTWMIGIAPMISTKLWILACETYAKKQSENPNHDPLEVSSYYLACHKVEEAIKVLCEGTLFREALALAKCRLSEDDPMIADILNKWASYCNLHGNYELGAQCYVALGEFEKAAKLFFRRQDLKSLEFGLHLAMKTENVDLQKALEFRYNAFKTEEVPEE